MTRRRVGVRYAHPNLQGYFELGSNKENSPHPDSLSRRKEGNKKNPEISRQLERLKWRSRRGLLELDVVLKDFLDRLYPGLTPAEQEAFEQLLAVPDETLLAYVQGKQNPPEEELMQLVQKIRN
jgi:antitoxin CptB